jgi:transketolase
VAGGKILNAIAQVLPNIIGGSADLGSSNNTTLVGMGEYSKTNPAGRNIYYGIREHAMGGISNGLALYGGLRPFCSTFLVFSDYMKPSIRLAAIMKLPVIYVFTHDSIYVGEDGPTHQPIEHLMALRIIPGMTVIRPGDAEETVIAWQMALEKKDGPVALVLSRQNLEVFPKQDPRWKENVRKGGYIADDSEGPPSLVIVASGSEVGTAIAAKKLSRRKEIRVVSIPSVTLFCSQDSLYCSSVIPKAAKKIFVEAGITHRWGNLGSTDDVYIGIDRFGESGPGEKVAEHLGINEKNVAEFIEQMLKEG